MANTIIMEQHFERDKNLKASGATAIICGGLFLIFFLVQWKIPEPPKVDLLEGVEVNLGTTEDGSGTEQPMIQGEPGPTQNPDNTPQQAAGAPPVPSEEKAAEKDPDGPAASEPTNTTPKITPTNPAPVKKADPKPPAPPTPKASMGKIGGGTGAGTGNTKDTYNKMGNEGDGKGPGDKGQTNGTPNGKSYGPSKLGPGFIQIKGDRVMNYWPDAFADVEPGSVTVSVSVSPSGTGRFVDFVKGKFLNSYKNEISKYLRTAKFNPADHESLIEMTFNFKSR